MSILDNLLNRKPKSEPVVERKMESKTLSVEIGCVPCGNTPMCDAKDDYKALKIAKKHFLFQRCKLLIESRLWKYPLEVKSQNTKDEIFAKAILDIFYNEKIQKMVFEELFTGTGRFVLQFDNAQTKFYPFYNEHYSFEYQIDYLSRPTDLKLKQVNTLTNIDLGSHLFLSNDGTINDSSVLLRSLKHIDLYYQIMESQQKQASKGYLPFYTVSPDYASIDNSMIGDVSVKWAGLVKRLVDAVKNKKDGGSVFTSELPFKATVLNQTNQQTREIENIDMCIQAIISATGVSGSMVGYPEGSNRALSEQDRDNLVETTIVYWQDKIIEIYKQVLIYFIPDFDFALADIYFKQEETDETIELRNLAKETLAVATQYIDRGINFTQESLSKNFALLGLEVQNSGDVEVKDDVEDFQDSAKNRTIQKKNFSFERAINISQLKSFQYSDWIKMKSTFNILEKYKKVLKRIYKKVQQENQRATTDISFSDYMSEDEFRKFLTNLSLTVVNGSNQALNTKQTKTPETILLFIDELVKYHFDGGEIKDYDNQGNKVTINYAGFDDTIKTLVAGADQITDNWIESTVKLNLANFKNNVMIKLFNETLDRLAVDSGVEYVGTLGKLDDLIRDHHRNNSGYAWQLGKNPPDAKNPNFYLERWCRCSRFYGTKTQLRDAGFKIYEQK